MSEPSVVALVVNITTLKTKKLKWANPPTCIPKFALYISRPFLHVDHCVNSVNINFTLNLTQGVFIDRIYRINHTETWNFNAPTLVTSVSHKITAKCGILCPKTLLLTEKQLHAIQFFVVARNVCLLAIPKSCAQNLSIRLLENHSLFRVLLSFISLGIVFLSPARLRISDCTASEWRNDACSHSETSLFIYLFIYFLQNIPHHDPFY